MTNFHLVTFNVNFGTYLDSLGSDGFGNDDESLVGSPRNEDLGWGLACLLGNLLDSGSINDSRFAGDVVAEGRVGGDDDVLLLT